MPETLTEFAPAERAESERLVEQSRIFTDALMFRELLDHVPDMVMLLNTQRQIVYANRAVLETIATGDMQHVIGKRPGELFRCKHSAETAGGCGTTRFCSCCGAVRAILQGISGQFSVEECRMIQVTSSGEEALDLRVWASPVELAQQRFTFFVVVNIADEKRRLWLEKIFLHDVSNSAMALDGFAVLLERRDRAGSEPELATKIRALSARLTDEIEAHRQLVAAESGEIEVRQSAISSREVLDHVFASFNNTDMLSGRRLQVGPEAENVEFRTDRTLLVRVLANMVKNALEGSVPGETVTMGCRRLPDQVAFWVHNATYIPENVRLQIFNRSFSTKGAGRGLGTYSMKLLTEHYLGGRVSFTSTESSGTTFTATYPLTLQAGGGERTARTLAGEATAGTQASAPAAVQPETPISRRKDSEFANLRGASAAKTVLLVDDDPAIHDLVRVVIGKTAQFVATFTASDGLRLLRVLPVDLLLLDLNLPDIHGLDVLSQLRKSECDTRVVIITADDTPDALISAISDNAYEYLRKPFTMQQLSEIVERALKVASEPEINVLSAKPEWLELSIPCTRDSAERIEHFVRQLGSELSLEESDAVATAFRELLMNAVEWGGGLDPRRRVRISCIRGAHMLLYRIADPGPGFNFEGLLHSAAVHPEGVLGSTAVREAKHIRPGGLGVVMVKAIGDELIYNKAQNEVVFVKYIS